MIILFSVSYTENLPIGNFTISASETDKQYDQADNFVNSSITREEKSNTYTVSLNGNLGQVIRSTAPSIKLNNFLNNQLNSLSYNLSWSETNNEGTLSTQLSQRHY